MFIQTLRQALTMTWRDWRAGELRFLLVAIVIAVGALSSVGFFVDRVSNGLQRNAAQLLGADLVLTSDKPIDPRLLEEVQGLNAAETATLASMVMSDTLLTHERQSELVSAKAVSSAYPLRGNLVLETGPVHNQIPLPNTVWVDQGVLSALNAKLGDTLKLGDKRFTIAHIIKTEPDRGTAFLNLAPRVMLALSDLEATDLIKPGSRVTYRLLLSGSPEDISATQLRLEEKIATHELKGITVESLATGRPEMNATLVKAKQFLALVSLLSAMLAALAIALAARRFMLRHISACAMLRCLGMKQNHVIQMYLMEFVFLGIVASLLGALLGYLGHMALLVWLGSFITTTLPVPSALPALQAVAIGMLLLIGFAIPPILQLRNVPHNLMVRHETGAPKANTVVSYLLGLGMFALLLFWQTGNVTLAAYTLLGFIGGLAVFVACAWLFLRAMRYARNWFYFPAWRFAITGLQRRFMTSIVQVVSLSLGLMALLLLTVVRTDLIAAWQQQTPPDAPNQFIVNVFTEQKEGVAELLEEAHIKAPTFYPMIKGRLVAINNKPVNASDYEAENAKRLLDREFNISTMLTMQSYNQLVEGKWFDLSMPKPESSVEEGIAKTFKLKLGDKLSFNVAGDQIDVTVTSLRKLAWDSMQVNFFVIIDPLSARDLPKTWITAFHLPKQKQYLATDLTQHFHNLTIIDTGVILNQAQKMLNQVVEATEFLFLFTLASGVLVLYAALQSSQQERMRETAILRALGASRGQLEKAQWIEYGLLGGLAGLLAASGAVITGWVVASRVFDLVFHPNALIWALGFVAGSCCALLGGWLGLRHIMNQPPLLSLREE